MGSFCGVWGGFLGSLVCVCAVLSILCGFVGVRAQEGPALLDLAVRAGGRQYDVRVNGSLWLEGGNLGAFCGGKWSTVANGGLVPLGGQPSTGKGADGVGGFTATNYTWCLPACVGVGDGGSESPCGGGGPGGIPLVTSFTVYQVDPVVSFVAHYPAGARQTNPLGTLTANANATRVSATFPSFNLHSMGDPSLQYVTTWGVHGFSHGFASSFRPTGTSSGPVVLQQTESWTSWGGGPSLVAAPAADFLVSQQDVTTNSSGVAWWSSGPGGEFSQLPAGYVHETILVASWGAANAAQAALGTVLLAKHGVKKPPLSVVPTLGYTAGPGSSFNPAQWSSPLLHGVPQQLLVNVTATVRSKQVPVRFLRMGSWWHDTTNSSNYCIQGFESSSKLFPSHVAGLNPLQTLCNAVGNVSLTLDGNFFCPKNEYASQGLKFALADTKSFGLPLPDDAASVFMDVLQQGIGQKMSVYSATNVSVQLDYVDELRRNTSWASSWLQGLVAAATHNQISLVLESATPAVLLGIASLGAANEAFVSVPSDDDANNLFGAGYRSALYSGLGLAPRTGAWRSEVSASHPNPQLHAIVAAMSTGHIEIGDWPGDMDAALLRRTSDAAGNVLTTTAPLRAIDATFFAPVKSDTDGIALNSWAPRGPVPGDVWGTSTETGVLDPTVNATTVFTWHYFLAFRVTSHFKLVRADALPPIADTGGVVVFWRMWDAGANCQNWTLAAETGCVLQWPAGQHGHPGRKQIGAPQWAVPAVEVQPDMFTGGTLANGTHPHQLIHTFPVLPLAWVFLGDLEKFAAFSAKRFVNMSVTTPSGEVEDSVLHVTVRGGLVRLQ